ncbi:radical SAM protein [candidate division KSB1 bacterium]|nr:radical SAM protein [candidate division KSB1 bacterium]
MSIVNEIKAKTILRKHKKIDSWFISRYGMNFYRGCSHNCIYCDGRAEKYNVEGEFGKQVAVKKNAIEVLRRELDIRKRLPLIRGFMMIGGGVGDSYQPLESTYEVTRRALELMLELDFPVSVLTKSTLVERDIDILKKIDEKSSAIVSFSFSSMDERLSAIFEPGVPPPAERLASIRKLKDRGLICGMFLMPVIPFLTDTPEMIEQSVRCAKESGVDFIIFSGMTLKEGRQHEYFMDVLLDHYPELSIEYQHIYDGNKWGGASEAYYQSIHHTFYHVARKYRMPVRIPAAVYADIMNDNDKVVVMLEQIDYLLKLRGAKSPYGYAAYSVSKLDQPISKMKNHLRQLKGVGKVTESLILEILQTGRSSYLQRLMEFR